MNEKDMKALALHDELRGKIDTVPKMSADSKEALSLLYTPGVAAPCREIYKNEEDVYKYTIKNNTVAVLTDGSAVLGLGNIGAKASIPVMEGKAVLFKEFGGVNAFPICLNTQDVDEIVMIAKNIAPVFGAINLEDISSPRCVTIEKRLYDELDIPVFHDDQHGTAIVVASAIINALKVVSKKIKDVRIIISGAGAAGASIAKMLHLLGAGDILMFWKDGIITKEKCHENFVHEELATFTNKQNIDVSFRDAFKGSDVFIGVSAGGIVSKEMVASMNRDAVVFALANPEPEISYEDAVSSGARIVATGRSDYPNQVNNVLAFPGIFKGALEVKASKINDEMKLAAVRALCSLIEEKDLSETNIMPDAIDRRVGERVAEYVRKAAISSGATKKAKSNT